MKLLHINLHKPVTAKVPFFAVVDEQLHDEAAKFRWLTTAGSDRPIRSFYSKEKGRPVTESLARWVWLHTRGSAVDYVGHLDGDMLNCCADNLVELKTCRTGKHGNTGDCLKAFSMEARAFREALGIPLGGAKVVRGRPLPATADQIAVLREARASVAKDMSLSRFNAEVVQAELGRKLSWRGLQTLLGK